MTFFHKIRSYPTNKPVSFCILFLSPFVSYALFELVVYSMKEFYLPYALMNIGFIACLYLIVFAVSGSSRITVPVSSIIVYILSLAEHYVMDFRNSPILLYDIFSIRTAASVSRNYRFTVSPSIIISLFGVLILISLSVIRPVVYHKLRQRLIVLSSSVLVCVLYIGWFFQIQLPRKEYGINMWDTSESYDTYGYILALAISAQYLVKKAPAGYSAAKLQSIYDAYSTDDNTSGSSSTITPTNIICIMNESLSDLSVVGDFEVNEDYMPYIHSLSENTTKGTLVMPVFGAMTSNSEFEFLTGDSMTQLAQNSIAYQFNVKPHAYSLVSTLSDQGYTPVAMHPYPGSNWNRNTVYSNFGFAQFLDSSAYADAMEIRNYVSDQADYEKIVDFVASKPSPDYKLFIFNVTVQNHGGYDFDYENFDQEIHLTGDMEGKYPQTDRYLSLIKKSDSAFEYLIESFKNNPEPTMIVMFGDHEPAVEDEFFDEASGTPSSEMASEYKVTWYETPYIIWTNYDNDNQKEGPTMSAFYLAPTMLSMAGLSTTAYDRFLLDMKEHFPVIHQLGVYDSDGNYMTWDTVSAENYASYPQILDYEYIVYNHSLDSKKYVPLYTITSP